MPPEVVTAPAPAAAPVAAPAPAPAPAPADPAEPTVLDAGAPAEPFDWAKLEEKFQVKNDKGELDKDATAAKLAKSYAEIQKRASRGGEVRPATAADYVLTVPEAMKDVLTADDPGIKGFLGKAHAAGYTQKQIDLAIGTYAELAPQLALGAAGLDAAAATQALRQTWKTEEEFSANVRAARRAADAVGDPTLLRDAGNMPSVIRALAFYGKQLGEDTPPAQQTTTAAGDMRTLQMSEAYRDASHPEHLAVSKRVQQLMRQSLGAAADVPI